MPGIKALWPHFAGQAGKDGWPAARFLGALMEHELADRDRRRIERHVSQARLLPGKTIDTFDFAAVPMLSNARVNAVTAGDSGTGKADWKGGQHCGHLEKLHLPGRWGMSWRH
jgi:DNA replication protein DnaC